MPAVPFSVLADPPFAVVEDVDVARGVRRRGPSGGSASRSTSCANGAITALQAARRGRRIPVPLVGPDGWWPAAISGLLGAPIPEHVVEMLHRGRLADNGRMGELLGFTSPRTTMDVIDALYEWPTVVRTPARVAVASERASPSERTDTAYRDRGAASRCPVERTLHRRRSPRGRVAQRAAPGRAVGTWHVDDWGRDPALVDAVVALRRACGGARSSVAPTACRSVPAR